MNPSAGRANLPDIPLPILSLLVSASGRTIESTVSGNSMLEALPAGSLIRIQCDPITDFGRGDVVAFVEDSKLIAHRLVLVQNRTKYLLTRGDNSVVCDIPVPFTSVVGRVVSVSTGTTWEPPKPRPLWTGWRHLTGAGLTGVTVIAFHIAPKSAGIVVRVARAARRAKHSVLRRLSSQARPADGIHPR